MAVSREGSVGADIPPAERGELDDATLTRAQAGEPTAQRALVDRYQRRVFALVSRMLAGRPALVDDIAQEAFMKIFAGLSRFDRKPGARLSTWMLTVATRVCLDAIRDAPRPAEEVPVWLPSDADPEGEAAQRQLGQRVEAAMARLSEDQRAVLVLRAYHDFDYEEIAATLSLEIGTVKSRLARARLALREALKGTPWAIR
jgi:RNA polymerase sigma-70 factor (ECF subfamily)